MTNPTPGTTRDPGQEGARQVGSEHDRQAAAPLAEEARKLLSIVQDWAQRSMPEPPSGHGGPECQWCPLCQFASILRGEYPEVADRVAEAGGALAGALRSFLDAAAGHAPPTGSPTVAGKRTRQPRPGRPQPTPRVQHIRLDDDRRADGYRQSGDEA